MGVIARSRHHGTAPDAYTVYEISFPKVLPNHDTVVMILRRNEIVNQLWLKEEYPQNGARPVTHCSPRSRRWGSDDQ